MRSHTLYLPGLQRAARDRSIMLSFLWPMFTVAAVFGLLYLL